MKDNSILAEEFVKIKDGDLLAIIDFFKLNEEALLSKTSTELDEIANIYTDYIFALTEKSRYSRVLEIIEKIEKLEEFKAFRENDTEFDEDLRFYKYSTLFYKKKYKESKEGFNLLVNEYPENEDYQEWLIDSKRRISNRIFGLIMLLAGILMFFTLAIQLYIDKPLLKPINNIMEGAFILSFILYFIDLKRKRKLPILDKSR